jgi:hypothetical protein
MVRSGQNVHLNQEPDTTVNVAVAPATADAVDWTSRLIFDKW